jgi:hypothetical protein
MNICKNRLALFLFKSIITYCFFSHIIYECVFFRDVLIMYNRAQNMFDGYQHHNNVVLKFGDCLPWYVNSDFLYGLFLMHLVNNHGDNFMKIILKNSYIKEKKHVVGLINQHTLLIKIPSISLLDCIIKELAQYNWHDIKTIYIDLQNIQDTYDYHGMILVKKFIETVYGDEYYTWCFPGYQKSCLGSQRSRRCKFKGEICIMVNYNTYSGNTAQLIDLLMMTNDTTMIIGNEVTLTQDYLYYDIYDLSMKDKEIMYGVKKISPGWKKSYNATIVYHSYD